MRTLNYFQALEAAAGLVAEREWGSQAWYTEEGAVVQIETYLQVKIDSIASCPKWTCASFSFRAVLFCNVGEL